MKKNRWKSILWNIAMAIVITGILVFGFLFLREWKTEKDGIDFYDSLRLTSQQTEEEALYEASDSVPETDGGEQGPQKEIDFDSLTAINSDIIGWIWAEGLPIDYPVVRGQDNSFYMEHMFDKTYNPAGSIFMSSDNQKDFSDDVSVLYGHHMKNNAMFTSLEDYKDPMFYEQCPVLYLETPDRRYEIQLFAGYLLSGSGKSFPVNFADDEERNDFIHEAVGKSTFTSDIKVDGDDRIVILCTCSYEFEDARYAVAGRLVELPIAEDFVPTE